MPLLRSSLLTAAFVIGLSCTATAGSHWKRVKLNDNPHFTVDIPAEAHVVKRPPPAIMVFREDLPGERDLVCELGRHSYDSLGSGANQRLFAYGLKTDPALRRSFCAADKEAKTTGFHLKESKFVTAGGVPAAQCVSDYTESGGPKARRAISNGILVVAGARSIYVLDCTVFSSTQRGAWNGWKSYGSKVFTHVQRSLHLPKAAAASGGWKTVTIGKKKDLTIDVPANAELEKTSPGYLMDFAAHSGRGGFAICSLNYASYGGENLSRKEIIAKLKSGAKGTMCDPEDKVTNFSMRESKRVAFHGLPARLCVSSYTDTSVSKTVPGTTYGALTLAGAHHLYSLVCSEMEASQRASWKGWKSHWEGVFRHMQKSLHLPKSER